MTAVPRYRGRGEITLVSLPAPATANLTQRCQRALPTSSWRRGASSSNESGLIIPSVSLLPSPNGQLQQTLTRHSGTPEDNPEALEVGWRITGEKKMLHLTTKRKVHAKGEKGNCQGLVNSIKKQRLAVKAGRSDLTSQHGKNKTQWCLESWKQKREDR